MTKDNQQAALQQKALKRHNSQQNKSVRSTNLTHLPYRVMGPICVESKGRANNHPTQKTSTVPVIQCDFAYIKGLHDKQVIPVLTAIDVETRHEHGNNGTRQTKTVHIFDTMPTNISHMNVEGHSHFGTYSPTIRSGGIPHSLLKTTARTIGSNISVRQSPAYSSQSQGSIERFHGTLFNQVRTLNAQLKDNYKLNIISINHPIMPWVRRHSAYLLNRYAIHNDGKTSYFRRWNKEHKTPLCEFGETIQYMVAHHKKMPKLESRFYKGIWLGKDTMTSESIVGIAGKIIRTRTIRRQVEPEKYDRQLMDIINAPPWTPVTPTEALQLAMMIPANTTSAAQQATTETQTTVETTQQQTQTAEASTSQHQPTSTTHQQQTIV